MLLGLRIAGVLACLLTALEPTVELRQVTRVPNRVAVLVDTSRSMEVRPPDGGRSRAERAAALLDRAGPELAALQRDGHDIDLYGFGENVSPATAASLHEPPAAEAPASARRWASCAPATPAGPGAVVLISDGVDTGRIGKGPLDATTRAAFDALGAPIDTVGLGEKSLRDVSIAAVLADQLAFVRTPVTIEAVVRQTGLPNRQVEVTLERDGRPVASRGVILRGDRSEEKVSFDWLPNHPGNFVFPISTPVLTGEALSSNNQQSFTLKVIRDRVRILHLAGRPSWDERFLRSMLRRNPNVDGVVLHPNHRDRRAALERRRPVAHPLPHLRNLRGAAPVVRSGHLPELQLRPLPRRPFLPNVRDYVEEGGAIAMIGGDLSFASGVYGLTALRDVLPVELPPAPPTLEGENDTSLTTDLFKPRLTPEGHTHPVTSLLLDPRDNETRWGRLPPLEGINRVPRAKPNAATLLAHPTLKGANGKPAPTWWRATPARGVPSRC